MNKYILLLGAIYVSVSYSQFSQQGNKLFGTGSASTPEQGTSVALSADGNTAIVGGIADSAGVGAAWIFTRSGGHWSQQGHKLVGTGAVGTSQQGYSVAISADGNTAIVGAYDDNTHVGAAWIFVRSGETWSQQGSKLVGNDYASFSYQGFSVGISGDGNTVIVGGPYDNSNRIGAAWIYRRTGGTWSQVGGKLANNQGGSYGQQGYSVAISGDGNTVAVGANDDAPYYGSVFVYVWNGTSWVSQGNKLVGGYYSAFGSSVALSSDGNTLVVGGSGDYNSASVGAIWIFNRMPDDSWVLMENEIRPSDYTTGTPSIGCSVSVSSDGGTVIVGGLGDHGYDGAAWIFKRSISTDTVWTQSGTKLIGTDTVGASRLGCSVAISGDGNTAIAGGLGDSSFAGATWVYATPSAPLPVEVTSFTAMPNRLRVDVSWSTATELNNSQFDIERRSLSTVLPASAQTQAWIRVGSVAGSGTSNSPKSYSFSDNVASAGTYSYHLKQIDRNGEFKYSQEIQVQLGPAPAAFDLSQNYPNPFNPATSIEFTLPSDGRAILKVFNSIGQEVAILFDNFAKGGEYYQTVFDGSKLASGTYFARLQFGSTVQMKKLLLLK